MEINQLTKRYGEQVILECFSLSLPVHGIICLYGPSGCGKTTLLRLIAGLEQPDGGTIALPGDGRISMAFQEDRLLPWETAGENIRIVNPGLEPEGLLERLELLQAAGKYPRELSGGMQRRVAIARALHYDGAILLLDEPFKGLDTALKRKLFETVLPLGRDKLILFVTHDAEEAAALADTVLLLHGVPLRIEEQLDFAVPQRERTQQQREQYRMRIEGQ